MDKRKKIGICAAVVFAIAALAAIIVGIHNYQVYHATYIVIDGSEYRRDSTQLDLSGRPLEELEKVKELTALRKLNLRGTGITVEQYEDVRAGLPKCEILWSVPFQNQFLDNTLKTLTVTTLDPRDFDLLKYFPDLQDVDAGKCRDYDALNLLMAQRPDLNYTYGITLSGTDYFNGNPTLNVSDPDVDEILENLKHLPDVQRVNLTGKLPANQQLARLTEAYPEITFVWELDILGVKANTLTEFLDLSGVQMESTKALEDVLPYFYHLTQVDMVDCGISNEDMDALNKRHEETKFVWAVEVAGKMFRTDITTFMPVKLRIGVNRRNCVNLKYCEDMVVMDFGHKGIGNVDFVKYMPKLKYLLLCEARITDLTAIGNCTSLEYLELFLNPVGDYWPLTNLTNLRDLNLCRNPWESEERTIQYVSDVTPLLQMTWLDRLWLVECGLGTSQRRALRNALPNTTLVFESDGSTTAGFRYTPRYYQQRDLLEMPYFHN